MAAVRHLGLVLCVLGPAREECLVFITVQNLNGIDAVVSTIGKFLMPIHAHPKNSGFGEL